MYKNIFRNVKARLVYVQTLPSNRGDSRNHQVLTKKWLAPRKTTTCCLYTLVSINIKQTREL